jgi:hypothetical protein
VFASQDIHEAQLIQQDSSNVRAAFPIQASTTSSESLNIATLELGGIVTNIPSIQGRKLSQVLSEVDDIVEEARINHQTFNDHHLRSEYFKPPRRSLQCSNNTGGSWDPSEVH